MADNQQIAIEVKLEDGTFRKLYAKLEDDSKSAGKRIGDNLGGGFDAAASAAKGALGLATKLTAAIGGLISVGSLYKGIKDAIGSEQSIQQLNLALAQNGLYSEEAAKGLKGFIDGLEKTTAVSDDVIASGSAMLVNLGKLSGQGLRDATKAALDLSAGMNGLIGPDQAFTLLSKAAQGNTEALGRYGIKVRETGDNAADFARVMATLNAQFGGMAEQRLNTFGGALEKLSTSFGNALKEIGLSVTNSAIVKGVIKVLGDMFDQFTVGFEKLGKSGNVVDGLILKCLELAKVLADVVLPMGELLYKTFKFVFDAIVTGLQFAVMTVAQSVAGITNILAKVIPGMDGISQSLTAFASSSEAVFNDMTKGTMDSLDQIGNYSFTERAQGMLSTWDATAQQMVATHANAVGTIKNQQQTLADPTFMDMFIDGWKKANNNVQQIAAQMATTLRSGLVNGIANGFAAMGKAWQEGSNVLEALGKALLQTFGQLLIQLGTQVLTVGLLMSTVPILFGLQGPAAIIAGAGMIVAGGVLTAIAGSGGGAGGGGGGAAAPTGLGPGGGVAVSPVGGGLGDATAGVSEARAEPQTKVEVNIHGNVLDNKGTALHIAEIIQENFDLSGITTVKT